MTDEDQELQLEDNDIEGSDEGDLDVSSDRPSLSPTSQDGGLPQKCSLCSGEMWTSKLELSVWIWERPRTRTDASYT